MLDIDFARTRFEPACWQGLRQPVFVFDIDIRSKNIRDDLLEKYDALVGQLLPAAIASTIHPAVAEHPLISRLASTSLTILGSAGMPIMAGADAVRVDSTAGTRWLLGLPAVSTDIAVPQWALAWAARLFGAADSGDPAFIDVARQDLDKIMAVGTKLAPSGVNSLRFLEVAYEEHIPWRHLAKNVYQFGWGSKARWLDSTLTDATPRISVVLARDKFACAKVLRDAGLPVPRHREVSSAEQAISAANEFGYPVVIKPVDLDGGKAVFTSLRVPAAVARAYRQAEKASDRILLEKHYDGEDYRLQVFRDTVFWVAHRRAAYVRGDGEHSVLQLIERVNAERESVKRLDATAEQGIFPIVVDDEVHDWLSHQGLALSSVPEPGRHIRLRGAANVGSGGTREPALHLAHADNLALAVAATRILRLDLAGIDLLIPDIAISWRESGAVICEVNAQPQMSGNLHKQILAGLLKGNGRIPVIGVFGSVQGEPWFAELRERARARGMGIELAAADNIAGNPADLAEKQPLSRIVDRLLRDPRVDAIVIQITRLEDLRMASPVDRLDVFLVAGDVSHQQAVQSSSRMRAIAEWARIRAHQLWLEPEQQIWIQALRAPGTQLRLLDAQQKKTELESLIFGGKDTYSS